MSPEAVPPGAVEVWPALCVVGPLPPPSGGMASQCEQLVRLLRADGVSVELVRTRPPYRPRWIGSVPVLRVTPSAFLQRVFAKHDLDAEAIPHIVDLARFAPVVRRPLGNAPYLVVTRNLEQIHDIPTVLRAMAGEALRVLHSAKLANALRRPGLEQAARCAWPRIRACGLAAYIDVVRGREAS